MEARVHVARHANGTWALSSSSSSSSTRLPMPAPASVLVRVDVAGVSASEFDVWSGAYDVKPRGATASAPAAAIVPGLELVGTVVSVGSAVLRLAPGTRVAGLLPADVAAGACADHCLVPEAYLVALPSDVSAADACALLLPSVRSLLVLHEHAHALAGETVLLVDVPVDLGAVLLQWARHLKLRVLLPEARPTAAAGGATASTTDSTVTYLLAPGRPSTTALVALVMEATGGLGVDIVVQWPGGPAVRATPAATVASCLGLRGRWVTNQLALQVDPPVARILALKGATLTFANEQAWLLSGARMGQFLHYVTETLNRLAQRALEPPPTVRLPFARAEAAGEALENGQHVLFTDR